MITVLFADLVGSTGLAERLDGETVKLVVGDAITRVVAEIERFGGYVKDLAGDGVLAFFGAPIAHEDDAERAVRAGLAVSAALSSYASEVAGSFGIEGFACRVGIGSGPVVLGSVGGGSRVEYGAYGDTVSTTARLQSAAKPGSVLVDEPTYRLVERLFEWEEPAALELRGKSEPVVARVARSYRPPGQARESAGAKTPYVGRVSELAIGREALDALRAGVGSVVVVTGEPGIGKSRLLSELRDGFEGLWLEGRCVSYGESLPYWPFRDLLLGPAAATVYLAFNHRDPAISDPNLRRALAYAIDRQALETVAPANAVVGTGGLVPPALQGHTPDIALRFEPDKARTCLTHAPDTLTLAAGGLDIEIVHELARSWQETLGLEVSIVERGPFGDPFQHLELTGWLPGYPDPEYYLRLLLHSQSRTNAGGFSHAPFDELIERARQERDGRIRLDLFHQADRMCVVDQIALVPLFYLRSLAVLKPSVSGWWEFGKSCASFADLFIETHGRPTETPKQPA